MAIKKKSSHYFEDNLISSKNILMLLGVLFLSLFLLIFTRSIRNTSRIESTQNIIPPEVQIRLTEINKSNEEGFVTLTQEFGKKVKVVIELENVPRNIRQPAHIHKGSCIDLGNVLFSLNDVVNGKSETTIVTSMAELSQMLPLAVNVHKSTSQASLFVSCGNL